MDHSNDPVARQIASNDASWAAKASQYGFTLIFVAPLYFAAGAAGDIVGAAMTGEPGLHNLFAAAGAIYILHRCLWD